MDDFFNKKGLANCVGTLETQKRSATLSGECNQGR
jgi:hypothetical protein